MARCLGVNWSVVPEHLKMFYYLSVNINFLGNYANCYQEKVAYLCYTIMFRQSMIVFGWRNSDEVGFDIWLK